MVREAPDTEFSAYALERALALALAKRKDRTADQMYTWFETWAADRGGKGDRAQARLLVLQQRYRDGEFTTARDGLRAFVASHPDGETALRARLLLALATWRAGDGGKAIELLGEIVRANPGDPQAARAQFLVGYLFFAAGEQEQAQAAFLRVIGDYPNSPFAEKAIDFLGAEAAKQAEAEEERLARLRLPSARCGRVSQPLRVDGRLDDAAWQRAPILRLAHKGRGGEQAPQPDPNVAVRLLWDDTALYVAFQCTDDDVRSQAQRRDDAVLLWDAVRVLIAPPGQDDADGTWAYFDLAVGPRGTLADGKVACERGAVPWQSVRTATAWNGAGVRAAATVDGTLNGDGPDKGWTAELAVPFEAMGVRPRPDQVWRLNLVWIAHQAGRERVVTSWAPLGGWLPQPRAFGRVTLAAPEPK